MYSGGHADDVDYISWNPTHPELFCTSSQKDKRIVFWDARRKHSMSHEAFWECTEEVTSESRYIQQVNARYAPVTTTYAPDGRTLLYTSAGRQVYELRLTKPVDDGKEFWEHIDRVRAMHRSV